MKIKDLFYMQASDRKVLVFILSLAAVAIIAFHFLGEHATATLPLSAADSATVANRHDSTARRQQFYETTDGRIVERFAFDPNTADSTQLLRLGLQPWQVRSIYRYRAKGGIYRKKEDFARLYGLTQKEYRELEPYIRISDDYQPAATLPQVATRTTSEADGYQPYREYDRDTLRYPIKLKPGETINLATADTTTLKKVPGIGSGWARRIVAYGEQLGGYVHVGQLREIEEFPEEALPYFTIHDAHPRRMNVNKLTYSQLRRHPYINHYQARSITDYRRLRGELHSLDELSLHKDFPTEAIERLRPYVEF